MSQVLMLKRGSLAALTSANPVLARGEPVWVIDQNKFKVGDGIAAFTTLTYLQGTPGAWGGVTGTLADQIDLKDALDAKQETLVSGTNLKTINSTSLLGATDISLVASISSVNADIAVDNTDVTAPILTLNAATSGANKIVRLNASGKLDDSVLPALAIVNTYVVADETAQLALTVQVGDVAIRSDSSRTYINATGSNTEMADWQEILTPGAGVTGVAAGDGLDFTTITGSGSVVLGDPSSVTASSTNAVTETSHTHALSIDSDDVGEGSTNLYYTDTRARASLSAGDGVSYNSTTGAISANVNTTTFEFASGVLNIAVVDCGEIV